MTTKKLTVLGLLSFFLGLTCIFEAVRVQAGPVKLNLSDPFFLLLLLWLLGYKHHRIIKPNDKTVAQLTRMFLFILVFSLNFLSPILDEVLIPTGIDGVSPAIAYCIKTFANIIFFILLFSINSEYRYIFLVHFSKGFILGIVVHFLYSIIQLFEWYVLGNDIHTPLMEFFGITEEFLGGHPVLNYVMRPLVIRVAGFFWDPYFIGIMGCVAIFVSLTIKRVLLRNICLLASFVVFIMSFSRTGFVSFFAVLCMIPFIGKRSHSFKEQISIRKIIKYAAIVVVVVGVALPFVLDKESREELSQGLKYKTEIKADDEGDMKHVMYPIYSIEAVFHDPFHLLFGYGARNSSRGIYISGNLQKETKTKVTYTIESDWCKILIDNGIICFLVYMVFNISLVMVLIKRGKYEESYIPLFLLITVLATFISGFFYTINDSRWVWLVYAASIIYLNLVNEEKKHIY